MVGVSNKLAVNKKMQTALFYFSRILWADLVAQKNPPSLLPSPYVDDASSPLTRGPHVTQHG